MVWRKFTCDGEDYSRNISVKLYKNICNETAIHDNFYFSPLLYHSNQSSYPTEPKKETKKTPKKPHNYLFSLPTDAIRIGFIIMLNRRSCLKRMNDGYTPIIGSGELKIQPITCTYCTQDFFFSRIWPSDLIFDSMRPRIKPDLHFFQTNILNISD